MAEMFENNSVNTATSHGQVPGGFQMPAIQASKQPPPQRVQQEIIHDRVPVLPHVETFAAN